LRAKADGASSASEEGGQEQLRASSIFMSGAGASVASRAKGPDSLYAGSTPHRGAALVSDQQQQQLQLKFDQQLVAKEV